MLPHQQAISPLSQLARAALILLLCSCPPVTAAPQVQHWQTEQGADVYFVQTLEQPIIDIQINFDAGSARDGAIKGLAALCSRLLEQGADGMDANQLGRAFENQGALFSASVDRDNTILNLRSLSQAEQFEPVVENLIRLISRPDFPIRALERERRRMLVEIQARGQSPAVLARHAFYRATYGKHPYAHPVDGEAATVYSIQRKQLLDFHKRYYVGQNAVLTLVGDLDRMQAEELAERLFAALPPGEPAEPLPPVADLEAAQQILEPHPSSQTHILLGQPGVRVSEEDRLALYVGNHILGGGMVSRLFRGIRDEHGLAYSVYSYFHSLQNRGSFVLGMQTRSDQAPQALQRMRNLLMEFIHEGPTEEEVEQARLHITGRLPLQLDSNSKLLNYISWLGRYDLPPDYLDTFNQRVEAIEVEHIQAAFRRWIDLDRLAVVLVGEFEESAP